MLIGDVKRDIVPRLEEEDSVVSVVLTWREVCGPVDCKFDYQPQQYIIVFNSRGLSIRPNSSNNKTVK